jgi:hypothetical protein
MKQVPEAADGSNEFERVMLGDLEIVEKYMQRVMRKSGDPRLETRAFFAQAKSPGCRDLESHERVHADAEGAP